MKNIDDILQQRADKYGSFKHNAEITQSLLNVIITKAPNFHLLDYQHIEALHMIFHKISRMVCGNPNYIDNVVDLIGYAKLLQEHLEKKECN